MRPDDGLIAESSGSKAPMAQRVVGAGEAALIEAVDLARAGLVADGGITVGDGGGAGEQGDRLRRAAVAAERAEQRECC